MIVYSSPSRLGLVRTLSPTTAGQRSIAQRRPWKPQSSESPGRKTSTRPARAKSRSGGDSGVPLSSYIGPEASTPRNVVLRTSREKMCERVSLWTRLAGIGVWTGQHQWQRRWWREGKYPIVRECRLCLPRAFDESADSQGVPTAIAGPVREKLSVERETPKCAYRV